MRKRTTSLIGAASLVAASLAITLASPSANAAVGPGEDRQMSTPTAWWAYTNMTAAQVSSDADRQPRPADRHQAELRRHVAAVHRHRGRQLRRVRVGLVLVLRPDRRAPSCRPRSTTTPGSPSLSCTVLNGATECAAVMIKNTGANAEAWSAWVGSPSFINSKITLVDPHGELQPRAGLEQLRGRVRQQHRHRPRHVVVVLRHERDAASSAPRSPTTRASSTSTATTTPARTTR